MPARSTWRGSLEISGLPISVRAFNVVDRSPDIEVHQYHDSCKQRIQQQRICPIHGPIDPGEIRIGYEHTPDQVLLFTSDESQSLLPDEDKSIQVDCFVSVAATEHAIYTGKHLYLVPDGATSQRPFAALHQSLTSLDQVAFAKIVLHQRASLILIKPYGKLLRMSVVEYQENVRAAQDYESEVASVLVNDQELDLMTQLINSMRQNELMLDEILDPRTVRLSNLLECRLKDCLVGAAAKEECGNPSMDVKSIDSHSALAATLRSAINRAALTRRNKTETSRPEQPTSNSVKRTG